MLLLDLEEVDNAFVEIDVDDGRTYLDLRCMTCAHRIYRWPAEMSVSITRICRLILSHVHA